MINEVGCKITGKKKWGISTFMEFYDRVLGVKIFEHFGKVLVETIKQDMPVRELNILEVACGTGRITAQLHSQLVEPFGCTLTATDLSAAAIAVARRVLPSQVVKDVELISDVDMQDLPFPDGTFDVIVSGFGIVFPRDKTKVIREFKRVLRPEGRSFATVFHRNQLFEYARDEFVRHFGTPSNMLEAALSLHDPQEITKIMYREGVCSQQVPLKRSIAASFPFDEDDTKEFLYNVCVLLEDYNQVTSEEQDRYLNDMCAMIHGRAPAMMFNVEAWLLCGINSDRKVDEPSAPPTFASLRTFIEHAAGDEFEAEKARLGAGGQYDDDQMQAFRQIEYSRLKTDTYLDYVGGSLAPLSLLEQSFQSLSSKVQGNPHSYSATSLKSMEMVRQKVRDFFHAGPEYEVNFTANASAAVRIVAECFPFQEGSHFVLTKDNHTSVHSIREYASKRKATVRYVTLTPELLIWDESMLRALNAADADKPNLLAYPSQSNATGALHDLGWVQRAQERGFMVLLDVAAHVPTSALDLSECQPDFMCVSFYKIFGFPTGIGCLLAKRASLDALKPEFFSGGSVCYFSGPWSPTERILYHEDARMYSVGTPNYLALDSVSFGLDFIRAHGQKNIRDRTVALARWLETKLAGLRHDSNCRLVEVYPPRPHMKGATVMFNFYDRLGSIIPWESVNVIAASLGISIRSGCFCNMGAVQQATYGTAASEHCELDRKGKKIQTCKQFETEVLSPGTCGAMRVSFGIASTFRDAFVFYLFAKAFLNTDADSVQICVEQIARSDLRTPAHRTDERENNPATTIYEAAPQSRRAASF